MDRDFGEGTGGKAWGWDRERIRERDRERHREWDRERVAPELRPCSRLAPGRALPFSVTLPEVDYYYFLTLLFTACA